jgi:hypothetical protein
MHTVLSAGAARAQVLTAAFARTHNRDVLDARRCIVIATLLALTAFASTPAPGQTAGASGASPTAALGPVEPVAPQVVHRKRAGLVIAGSLVFVASWVPALAITATGRDSCDSQSCRNGHLVLSIPVLGPLYAAGHETSEHDALYVLWGLVQAGGIAMLVAGLIGHDVSADTNKSRVAIIPTASPHAAGVVLHTPF